ncbi:unnamed protein product [Mytilus coruscus]|uniref:IRG-type G domain-containing protein n=1 Tax=Mytilus coruscus TaxID=42192 RepID=A0A6J8DND0_MYTCO|nr:unnamed protein product [Mytilus coruscus]
MSTSHSGKCLNCRLNINEVQRFCENCGYKIEANSSTVVCLGKMEDGNQCNGLLRNDASFCPNCGTPSHILVLFKVAQASASNVVTMGANSELLYTRSTDDEDGDILRMSDAVLDDEAQASVSNMEVADSESLSTRSTDDEDGDIWEMSDAVLEDEALDNPNVYADLYSQLESEGATRTEASLEERLNRWETEEVQFGIVGRSAMGKSTFINLLLNLSPTDPGYAEVEEGDCTTLIKIYEHPKFGTFKLVDFPGFGTLNMTKDQFHNKFNSVNLDYFFVFIDTVFMEEDIWLVKKLKERGISYSFVRSKIDVIVDRARKNGTNEQEEIAQKRRKLEDTMARTDILRGSKLFLISNFREYFHCGDLIRLLKHITSLIPDGKVEALLFFLPLLTPELIVLKCKTLIKRMKFTAFAAGVVSAIPIPFVDLPVNIAIVTREVRRYIRVLNLDHQYVKKVPGLKHPSLKEKKQIRINKGTIYEMLEARSSCSRSLNNSSLNNDQQEDSASKLDLTTEHQNSTDRMSPTTDERQTSIQQYLETDKSNSHNDKNDGDIPSRAPKPAVNDIKRLLAGSGQSGLKQTTYRIENVIEALDDISSARSIIIHVGINNIKVREDSAEDIFPRYEEMVNKALGKANSVVLPLVIPTKYTLLNKKSQTLNEMIESKFATTSTLLICENNNFTADNGDVMENLYSDSIRLSIYQDTGVLAGNIRKTMFPHRQSENKRVSQTDHTKDSTNYGGRTNYNYNHRFRNTGYNKSHQYKGDDTRRPLYNNNWYTHDNKTELGHYRNNSTRKSFDYDNSYMYNTDGEVNHYRNDDNRTSEYNQSYRHEMDRDLSKSQISDLATSIASAFANILKCH